jgi:metal-responsive CopG/Arc/MetJ family transcriptional regulator
MPSPQQDTDFSEYLGVKMPTDLMERIDRAARRQDRTVSSFVRHTLRRRLDAEDRLREDAAPASQ